MLLLSTVFFFKIKGDSNMESKSILNVSTYKTMHSVTNPSKPNEKKEESYRCVQSYGPGIHF